MSTAETIERVRALTRFAGTVGFDDLPASVVVEAKNRVMDVLGCILAGVGEHSSQVVYDVLRHWSSGGEATVVGRARTMPAALAAFCNGAAGHAVELDDDHKQAILHPGVCVIPAALAAGERVGASGRDLLTAIVVGYEVICRIGEAARPDQLLRKGFHPTGICGAFGAAAAASRVQHLPVDRFRWALGIAGSFASGLFAFVNDGSLTKRLHSGNAAKAGVLAAQLAAEGYSGPGQILEGPFGFFSAFADGCDPVPLDRGLGSSFEIVRTSFKQYACCSYCHPLMDALSELRRRESIRAGDVVEIIGRTFSAGVAIVGEPLVAKQRPATPVDAQFSAPYCLSVFLCDGMAMPAQFRPERVADPEVQGLARRVTIEASAACDREFPASYPAEVMVRMADGRVLTASVRTSKGDPSWPLSQAEIEAKFQALSGTVLSRERISAIGEAIHRLDDCSDVREFMALLRDPS